MLKWVQINNFRSCGHTMLPFFDSITAVVGKNGVGKSNVLLAIDWMARRAGTASVLEFPLAPHPDQFEILARFELEGRIYSYEARYPSFPGMSSGKNDFIERLDVSDPSGTQASIFERRNEVVHSRLRDAPLLIGANAAAMYAVSSLLPAEDSLSVAMAPVRTFFSGIQYYLIEDTRDNLSSEFVQDAEYQKWRQQYLAQGTLTRSVAYRLLYMYYDDKAMLEEFKSLIGRDGLGIVDFTGVQTVDSSAGEKSSTSKFHFFQFVPLQGMGGSGTPRGFSSLSSGTRRAIRILVSLLFDRRSVMLVEEPEVSIHPGLLRKLVDIFRSYSHRSQVIFTTHSPEVLDMLNPEEIVLLSAPAGSTVARTLSQEEVGLAQHFLRDEGSLSDYFETLDEYES